MPRIGIKNSRDVLQQTLVRAIRTGGIDMKKACSDTPSLYAKLSDAFTTLGETEVAAMVMASADGKPLGNPAEHAPPTRAGSRK